MLGPTDIRNKKRTRLGAFSLFFRNYDHKMLQMVKSAFFMGWKPVSG